MTAAVSPVGDELVPLSYLLEQRKDLEPVLDPVHPSVAAWVAERRWLLRCVLERTAVLQSPRDTTDRVVVRLQLVLVHPGAIEWKQRLVVGARFRRYDIQPNDKTVSRARGLAIQRANRQAKANGRPRDSASHNRLGP